MVWIRIHSCLKTSAGYSHLVLYGGSCYVPQLALTTVLVLPSNPGTGVPISRGGDSTGTGGDANILGVKMDAEGQPSA